MTGSDETGGTLATGKGQRRTGRINEKVKNKRLQRLKHLEDICWPPGRTEVTTVIQCFDCFWLFVQKTWAGFPSDSVLGLFCWLLLLFQTERFASLLWSSGTSIQRLNIGETKAADRGADLQPKLWTGWCPPALLNLTEAVGGQISAT